MKTLIAIATVFLCLFLHNSGTIAADAVGELCISPVNAQNFYNEKFYKTAPKGYAPPKYAIQVDNGKIVEVKFDASSTYSSLTLKGNHLVTIWKNDKLSQSFRFGFEVYGSNKLCLWHKPKDESWALWAIADSKHICECSE